jgi:FixJ family two-component response regulator
VLLTSGYTDDKSQLVEIRKRNLPFLQKPYAVGDLLAAVGDAIRLKAEAASSAR